MVVFRFVWLLLAYMIFFKAIELNDFCLRFDAQECSLECRDVLESLIIEDTSDPHLGHC